MKVAIVLDKFPKLSETFVLDQIWHLKRRGVDVTIFAREPGRDSCVHERAQILACQARYYGSQRVPPRWRDRARVAQQRLRRSDPDCRRVLLCTLNPMRYGRAALSLRPLLHGLDLLQSGIDDYDIVHCHFGPTGQRLAPLKAAGIFRGRLITSFHGYDLTQIVKANGRGIYRELFREADVLMPVSERFAGTLRAMGCPPGKVRVHRMGIDVGGFAFEPRTWREAAGVRIVSIGRLVEKKGFEHGIRAMASLARHVPNIRYDLIGEGPLRPSLEKLTRTLGLEKIVRFRGALCQTEVAGMLSAAHILLLPSVTANNGDQEGIPVVLMEAMACGLAVVATRHSGIPELVVDGETGYLVGEGDEAAMSERLAALIQDGGVDPNMASAARRRVEIDHDIRSLTEALLTVYESLLSQERVVRCTRVHRPGSP